jgi:hypothetical protein
VIISKELEVQDSGQRMFQEILNSLGLSDTMDTSIESRRQHLRRSGVQADVKVGGQVYSVRDWSFGGIFFDTPPDPRIMVGDQLDVKIQFRLPHETVEIDHRARVVRATRRGIATAFEGLTPEARRLFERVIDGINTQSFADSQVA